MFNILSQKRCTKCEGWKDKSEFYVNRKNGVLSSRCKSCIKNIVIEWRKANPEAYREKINKIYQNNIEKKREAARKRRRANPERDRETKRKYRLTHPRDPEKRRQEQRRWNAKKQRKKE